MRLVCSLAFGLITAACCLAQQQEKKLLERVLAKPDMALMNHMSEKKFDGGGFLLKKPQKSQSFGYEQKLSAGKYQNVRSFLGLKNPWFGKSVYEAGSASLWSKALVVNGDRKVAVRSAPAPEFYQAQKKVTKQDEAFRTSAYLGRGSAQGRLDKISEKMDKHMTIEEVREILNKDR